MTNPTLFRNPDQLDFSVFMERIRELMQSGYSPLHYFGSDERLLYALLGKNGDTQFLCSAFPPSNEYSALTVDFPAFSMYERLLYEDHGIRAWGHPQLKVLKAFTDDHADHHDYLFLASESSALHEVGVGPVHAGVIEPGHFRFICRGEIVEHLEIKLGYQHRGVERLMLQGDIRTKNCLAESIAGDTSIGHALAWCLVLEGLTGTKAAAFHTRMVALELERIAMHLSVLSALSADVAYIMGQNMFAALRTTVINSSLAICGSRFGKRWLTPGGVHYGISKDQVDILNKTIAEVRIQVTDCCEALFKSSSVLSRFDDTGILKTQDALALGLTGITAKSSGVFTDARMDYPLSDEISFTALCENSGDVWARAHLRYREIIQSLDLVARYLERHDPSAVLCVPLEDFQPDSIACGFVEGYRGRIVHVCKTDPAGKPLWYKIVDPSFTNWQALALVMRNGQISDFPICNKSFDLSYSGSDL
jgi:Ni,Fe-hydrogenase III large subunit